MTEKDFFRKTLGLEEPWEVVEVKLDLDGRRVDVELSVEAGTKWCEGGELLPVAGYEEREWRHLDTMQLETVLRARVPRVRYPDGTTKMVSVPWAGERSRWTLSFEALAVEVLRASSSVEAAAKWLRIGWRSADRIMARAVERGLARRELEAVEEVGIDEKSYRKGHSYGTLVNDLRGARVIEVCERRTTESACEALDALGEEGLKKVRAVAIDMSAAYESAVKLKCPNAAVVYDRYHVSALLGTAVDGVRRAEHAKLMSEGDDTLKGTRYDWLFDPSNMGEERYARFEGLVQKNTKTSRAWYHRIMFTEFWEHPDAAGGGEFFKRWFMHAVRSKLPPVVKAARTLKRHLPGLLNYFSHRITNALSEGLNSRIQAVKAAARGFHGFDAFRTRILFFLGGLDLKPR
jgi:transposase